MTTWTELQNTCLAALTAAPYPYAAGTIPPDFATLFPQATQAAESRISQEIPMLGNRTVDYTSFHTTAGNPVVSISTAFPTTPVVVEGFALVTPAGTAWADGPSQEFERTSLDAINLFWPDPSKTMNPASATWVGRYYAMYTNGNSVLIAPTPEDNYTVVLTGLYAPSPISVSAPQTYLSTTYPSLMEAATICFLLQAYKRNASGSGDDPRSALNWESTYQTLKAAAEFEEKRRRGLLPDEPRPAPPPPAAR